MTHDRRPADRRQPAADVSTESARDEEEGLRERWEATQASFLERFDEPIGRATRLTKRTLAWFPVRVWRHFLQHNGFLLAAGVSYQALFAFFAAIYVAFAVAGLWLGGSPQAVQGMIDVINRYIPHIIGDDGLVTVAQVTAIATGSAGALGVTGAIALGTVIWTGIGFVTFARRAVRDIFGIPRDRRAYALLKALDLIAAVAFGIALIVGALLGSIATSALQSFFSLFGGDIGSGWFTLSVRIASIVVSFALTSAALAVLFRFLTGTNLRWRTVWPGSLLGGGAITVLQLGVGLLLGYTPTNPLLATFALFIGLLLWFRIIGIIMLVASAWIAVAAADRDLPLLVQSEADRLAMEYHALLLAAEVRLRTAEQLRRQVPWWRSWGARRALREAREELAHLEASTPPAPGTSLLRD